ncbi:MAG TPA: 4-hydroxythreonine-4-phosphate dehydrogenase PdxA [Clostridiaceae bacterium]|nr:4-hydroxythreonine-4-phosphate dehydrogenase PdxA [Clostridiaceae bacterium]
MRSKPIIGITMGDPAGNGSELSIKSLLNENLYEKCRPIIIGDADCMKLSLNMLNLENKIKINPVDSIDKALFQYGIIDVYDLNLVDMNLFTFGKVSAMCGNAAFRFVEKAIELALSNQIDATVTNAINKEAINKAGFNYAGHTEIYAKYTNTDNYTMMLAEGDLRVVHVSTHVSLREACNLVKRDRVLEVIRIANQGCKDLGIKNPKIGVAGLNPHSGENGLFGKEEIEEIQPAIDLALAEGIDIPERRPTPADTIFSKAIGGWYDIVVCMYHDQGHIPVKVKGFVYDRNLQKWKSVAGVNITLGIPIIRVSVDHGTGFDLAGKGISSPDSLNNAIEYAIDMANAR